jgi:hypothetical protein
VISRDLMGFCGALLAIQGMLINRNPQRNFNGFSRVKW